MLNPVLAQKMLVRRGTDKLKGLLAEKKYFEAKDFMADFTKKHGQKTAYQVLNFQDNNIMKELDTWLSVNDKDYVKDEAILNDS